MLLNALRCIIAILLIAAGLGEISSPVEAFSPIQQTTHVSRIAGNDLEYQAILDEFEIKSSDESTTGRFVTFTYLKASGEKQRPIIFMFNGGPGSASHWLHLGGFGPKKIALDAKKAGTTTNNDDSLLPYADLVFIDPIGTGFSNTDNKSPLPFWNIVEDAKSISRLIQQWLRAYKRGGSPLYIMGESYGALRATLVADELLRVHARAIKGMVLLSPVQNYRNIRLPDGSVMGYVSYLPTYAATAWHHGKVSDASSDFETFLQKARTFASGPYANALISGNRLTNEKRTKVANQLSHFTGLPTEEILAQNLRIKPLWFLQQLRSADTLKLSRLDSRQFAPYDRKDGRYGADPFAKLVRDPFEAATFKYVQNRLQAPSHKGRYVTNSRSLPGWRWNWNVWGEGNIPSGSRYINVIPNLERTLRNNPDMRVYVASGYFDFATPFYSSENALSELTLGNERVEKALYPTGHLIYLDRESRTRLSKEILNFIKTPTAMDQH